MLVTPLWDDLKAVTLEEATAALKTTAALEAAELADKLIAAIEADADPALDGLVWLDDVRDAIRRTLLPIRSGTTAR